MLPPYAARLVSPEMSQSPPSAPASVASLLASLVKPPGAAASSTPGSSAPNAATPAATGGTPSANIAPTRGSVGSAAATSLSTDSRVLGVGVTAPRSGMAPLRVVRREPAADCAGFANDMHPVLQRIYAA